MAFDWDEGNLAHIAEHGVTAIEAEEVLDNDPLDLEVQMVDGEERFAQVGSTKGGRVLMIATTWRGDELRVVTAFPASPGFRQLYLREKNMAMSKEKTEIPKFENESEEAAWWFNNQDYVLGLFEKAKAEGRLGHGTAMRQMAERQAAKSTTIRLDPGDLSLAKAQAEKKGLRYQTYLKMLIHEALGKEAHAGQ